MGQQQQIRLEAGFGGVEVIYESDAGELQAYSALTNC